MDNYFSYMRISTKEERGKQKYNRQESSLNKYATEHNINYLVEFKEDESGKNFINRKQWLRLEKLVQNGDTIVFKDISRFTREAENGYKKYMELMNRGVELIFIDNPTISTSYIKQMLNVANKQNLVTKVSLENTVKLLLYVELDRVEQERLILINRIKDGIKSSAKRSGKKLGSLDKLNDELKKDIELYLKDRTITQTYLINKHHICRNTLKKYINNIKNNWCYETF